MPQGVASQSSISWLIFHWSLEISILHKESISGSSYFSNMRLQRLDREIIKAGGKGQA